MTCDGERDPLSATTYSLASAYWEVGLREAGNGGAQYSCQVSSRGVV
jgi:hypothetical protein